MRANKTRDVALLTVLVAALLAAIHVTSGDAYAIDCEECYNLCGLAYSDCLQQGQYPPGSCPLSCELNLWRCYLNCNLWSLGICDEDPGQCVPS